MTELTENQIKLLEAIKQYLTPTTNQLYEVLPDLSERRVRGILQELEALGYIQPRQLQPSLAKRSPHCYRLTAKGARSIGIKKLPGQHYRVSSPKQLAARSIALDLEKIAEKQHWEISHSDDEAIKLLLAFIAEIHEEQENRKIEPYQVRNLVPATISPDIVISTPREAVVVIRGYHGTGSGYWTRRIKKYATTLNEVRFVAIAIDDVQIQNIKYAINVQEKLLKREGKIAPQFLILHVSRLAELSERL